MSYAGDRVINNVFLRVSLLGLVTLRHVETQEKLGNKLKSKHFRTALKA